MITETWTPRPSGDAQPGPARGVAASPTTSPPVAVFLASDHARYITGATINVSGGMLL